MATTKKEPSAEAPVTPEANPVKPEGEKTESQMPMPTDAVSKDAILVIDEPAPTLNPETPAKLQETLQRRAGEVVTVHDENSDRREIPPMPDDIASQEELRKYLTDIQEDALTSLVGGEIQAIVESGNTDLREPKIYGLVVKFNQIQAPATRVIAWIHDTPEGNGPGFLKIEEET